MTKIFFFSDNVEWSSKNLWKMVSSDVKANKNNKKSKILWLLLTNFCKKYLQNLRYNVKSACIFIWFWLIFYPLWYCPLKIGGMGRGFFNGQNQLTLQKLFVDLSFLRKFKVLLSFVFEVFWIDIIQIFDYLKINSVLKMIFLKKSQSSISTLMYP